MPGQYYRLIVPRTTFDFSGLGSSQSQAIVLKRYIDVSQYRELTLVVRVHALTIGTGTINVYLLHEAPTAEDPVYDATAGTPFAWVGLTSSVVAPTVILGPPTLANVGSFLAIQVTAAQGSIVGALKATVSVDVSAKS